MDRHAVTADPALRQIRLVSRQGDRAAAVDRVEATYDQVRDPEAPGRRVGAGGADRYREPLLDLSVALNLDDPLGEAGVDRDLGRLEPQTLRIGANPEIAVVGGDRGGDPEPRAATGDHREHRRGAELRLRTDPIDRLAPRTLVDLDLGATTDPGETEAVAPPKPSGPLILELLPWRLADSGGRLHSESGRSGR